ncbi:TonB-dependent receptor [Hymenobacter psychrotolerans]|uniref:Iron complex outermembrane recepter protein n=1 Tax=Hymenobacter psychrotolerans DSM 18569 TaxID=1121959 RepID=A0A1M6PCL5_9BACT|nr:TonB-dependent receptor [Hymenobacter psychrotolerans]SHK05688.1 iron complex outermembrane recepter protein [Hymenobacter psychrotolerans DSM 18569]
MATTLLGYTLSAQAQQASAIRGRVTTSDGTPAEAVTVGLKGRGQGTITNSRGEYVLERVRPGEYTLVVSAIGLKGEEKTITVVAGQSSTVDFSLAENAERLKEVVVSGNRTNKFNRPTSVDVNKMPLNNLENPQVYATVGKELLTEQLVFTVEDATRNTPGLQKMWDATGRGGDGGAFYASRGFVLQSQLRNGVAGNVTGDIDAVNLEKLELIKGPSATLFGSALTSYGGLMNRVTKKPTDTFGGEVSVAAGSYGFHRVSADVNLVDSNTPADQPKTLGIRLNTAYTYEDNFQSKGYAGFNKNLAVAPSLQWRPNDRLTVNLDAEIYKGSGVGKQMIFFYYPSAALGFDRADKAPLDYRQSYMGPGLTQDSRSTNLFGQVQYRISPSFTATTYLTSSHSYSNGFGPYFYLLPGPAGAASDTLVRSDQSTGNSRRLLMQAQQHFNGDFQIGSLRNRVVLGLDFLRIDSDVNFLGGDFDKVLLNQPNDAYRSFNGPAVAAKYARSGSGSYLVTTKSNTYSAFVSDVLNLTEQLSILAALRLDHFENKGGLYYGPNTAYSQTALSPKFGVVFQPVKDRVSIFGSYQNSFKNPTDGSYIDVNRQQRTAKVEQANQWEGGVKLDAAGGRISATLSYYDVQVKDLLRSTPVPNTNPASEPSNAIPNAQTQNGTQLSRGTELNLTANPIAGLNVVAGFAYNHSEWKNSSEIENGRRPNTASSPYLANAWVSYRQPAGALKGLGAGFGGNYASENRIQNTSLNVFTLPSYTVLNASIFYDQPKYRISAKIDNLTDQQYWIGYTTMNPQKLRSIIGSLAYKF